MTNIEKASMLISFKALGQPALSMNHYDLAAISPDYPDPEQWKEFLLDPSTIEYINKEMELIRKAQLNKLQKNAADSKSVGQAQLLTSLAKLDDTGKNTAEGPAFIYCYVPLTEEQEHAPNIRKVDEYGRFIT